MGWPKGQPRAGTGVGRKAGGANKRSIEVEAWARGLLEDATVRKSLEDKLKQGSLPPVLVQMLFAYAYGKPREQQRDDQVFMEDLLGVVLKHVGTAAARHEIQQVLEAHHAGATGLRSVA
jgi:hypothetical protein